MTIAQAISQSSIVKPGPFTDADKLLWLAQLDGQIDAELIRTHEGALAAAFVPYTEGTDPAAQLLVPDPYSKLYVSFLCAQMDFYSAEYARFNNTQKRFETEYREAADFYNRTHPPLKVAGITVGEAGRNTAENPMM